MRATPRGLALVAWANVVVGAADVWRVLPTLLLASHDGTAGHLLPFVLMSLLQVVAGLGLLEGFATAHRYLLLLSGARILLAGPWIRDMAASPAMTPPGFLGLLAIAIAAITLKYLLQEDVRKRVPPLPLVQQIAVDTVATLLLFGMRHPGTPVAPPVVEQQARNEQTEPARKRPAFSSRPIRGGTGSATLVPTYDGEPIGELTAADVRLTLTTIEEKPWIRDGVVRSTQILTTGTIERPWRVHHGRIRISSVPAGLYRVRIAIDRRRGDGIGDGDVFSGGARIEMRTGHGPFREVLPLLRPVTLRAPQTGPDPGIPSGFRSIAIAGPALGEAYDRLPRIPSHVAFEWDPVPRAVKYSVMLGCDDFPTPIQATVRSTSWTTDLPQCQPPHPWKVVVSAFGSDGYFIGNMGQRAFVVAGTPESRAARGLRPAPLTLRPTFDGRPFRSLDTGDVLVVLLPVRTPFEPTYPPVRVRHGRIKIPRFVPDGSTMTMMIGPNARDRAICRPQPGDFSGMEDKQLQTVHTDWQPESRTFELRRVIRSVEPEDAATCVAPLVHVQSPVELRWEPVPEAVEYTLQMTRPGEWRAEPQQIVVREPVWRGELASTGPVDRYFVKIAARSAAGADIALLQHTLAVD